MAYKIEPFDIWHFLCVRCHNYTPTVKCRIDFGGRVDAEALKQAVTLSKKTIPLIGCCILERRGVPRWAEMGFTGEDMVAAEPAGGDTEAQIARHLTGAMDITAEPQMKITIVKGVNGDTLCINISHIVCDGAGAKQYIYLLGEIYTRLLAGQPPPAQSFEQRGLEPILAPIGLRKKARILRSGFRTYSELELQACGETGSETGGREIHIVKRTLPKESFGAFKTFLNSNQATVNDGFMALFARAYCKNNGVDRVLLPSTMDLRKYMPQGIKYGISNYTSDCMCDISAGPGDSIAKTVASVSAQMRAYKSGDEILKSILKWDMMVRFIPYKTLRFIYMKRIIHPTVYYTNMGILNENLLNYDFLPITDAFLTTTERQLPYLQLNVSTYDSRCTINSILRGSRRDRLYAERMLDDICEEARAPI